MKNLPNERHRKFKNELRTYHDSINRKNRYNLPKISGKLNVFEASTEEDEDTKIEKDRIIPNTNLMILEKNGLQAIATREGKPITDFKYKFIEGSLGSEKKLISCITDDGTIEYFDVDNELIVECAAPAVGGGISTSTLPSGGKSSKQDDYHEIDYDKVKKDLTIPYLSGYRIKDMRSGKILPKGIKHKKHKRK